MLVVIVALVGGLYPALFAALLSGLTLDFFFIAPLYAVTISDPLHVLALALYPANAGLVSHVVDQAARRSRTAMRAAAESELLATVAGSVLRGQDALQALVTRTQEAFGLTGIRLRSKDVVLYSDGEPAGVESDPSLPPVTTLPVGAQAELELHGADLDASKRRLLAMITTQMSAALERTELKRTAGEMGPLAAADRRGDGPARGGRPQAQRPAGSGRS